MRFEVSHRTSYTYASPVAQSQHLLHLRPRATAHQSVAHHNISIDPDPAARAERLDAFGNASVTISLNVPHTTLTIDAVSRVETQPRHLETGVIDASTPWDQLSPAMSALNSGQLEIRQYTCASDTTRANADIFAFAQSFFPAGRSVLAGVNALNQAIFKDFSFDPVATDVSTPVSEVFAKRHGVCQDFSHLALTCLRALSIPAKYVSGYIQTLPPPGEERLVGADASHAWISVWAPETGWVDFDPTNGLIVQDQHVTVAFGRDYQDVCPINGILLGGGDHKIDVAVDVRDEDEPRSRDDLKASARQQFKTR
ncbi:MAG: transglutaminase family protein [Pseudomonadota bacterium]